MRLRVKILRSYIDNPVALTMLIMNYGKKIASWRCCLVNNFSPSRRQVQLV